jgi:hypothetical protein
MAVPETGDRPGRGRVGSTMASVVPEMTQGGLDNQILRYFKGLRYICLPTVNNCGELQLIAIIRRPI